MQTVETQGGEQAGAGFLPFTAAVEEREPELTVLSFGGGQDSWAILLMLVFNPAFRKKYAPGRLLVLMCDTGDEAPETYLFLSYVKRFCARHGVEFVFITNDMGYHTAAWMSLPDFNRRTRTAGMRANATKSCTANLKINVFYRFLEVWLGREYGVPVGRKVGFHRFKDRHGPVRVLIGLAAGEERRLAKKIKLPLWRRATVEQMHPLMDEGMGRVEAQAYARSAGEPVPVPSNCMRCPFLNEMELLLLARKYPFYYEEWVEMERAKFEKFAHLGEKNYGVFGKRSLPETLVRAEAKYGHMSTHELEAERMLRGHCVKSAY